MAVLARERPPEDAVNAVAATLSKLALTGAAGPRWTVTEAWAWPLVAVKVKLRGSDHVQPCWLWTRSEHCAHEYMGHHPPALNGQVPEVAGSTMPAELAV